MLRIIRNSSENVKFLDNGDIFWSPNSDTPVEISVRLQCPCGDFLQRDPVEACTISRNVYNTPVPHPLTGEP